jgi:hypothetical protein
LAAFGLLVACTAGGTLTGAGPQGIGQTPSPLPLTQPIRERGSSVTPAFEGWYFDKDGSQRLLVGYFNRNLEQVVDIPIGPNNRIDPGGPDYGQPTHFLPRRQWGVFTITVPADFGNQKITWTLTAHGKSTSVPMALHRDYEVSPFKEEAQGNTPPVLKFDPKGPSFQGPPVGIATSLSAAVGQPLTLTVWAADDAVIDPDRKAGESPVTISWSQFRGPAEVTFANAKPPVDKTDGRATTTATFKAPGEYVLRAQANDVSGEGGGGFQCCWTNALVRVTVGPAPLSR